MSVVIDQKIEFVGETKWVFTDAEKLGHSSADEGEMLRSYIECDDIRINGESIRDGGELDPDRPLRFQFWQGEQSVMVMQPST